MPVPPRALLLIAILSFALALASLSTPQVDNMPSPVQRRAGTAAAYSRGAAPAVAMSMQQDFSAASEGSDSMEMAGGASDMPQINAGSMQQRMRDATASKASAQVDPTALKGKLMIKTAAISGTTIDVPASANAVVTAVTALGGYAESRNLHEGNYYARFDGDDSRPMQSASLRLRVPVAQFDAAVAAIKKAIVGGAGGGRIVNENVQARDATAEYADAYSRQRSDEVAFAQTEVIMAAAVTVTEVLAVKAALDAITSRLDSSSARRKALEGDITLSAIDVSLETTRASPSPTPPPSGWSPLATAGRAAGALARGATIAVDVVIFAAVFAVPLTMIVAAAYAVAMTPACLRAWSMVAASAASVAALARRSSSSNAFTRNGAAAATASASASPD